MNLLIKKKILNYVHVAVKNQIKQTRGGGILSKVTSNIYFSFIHILSVFTFVCDSVLLLFVFIK